MKKIVCVVCVVALFGAGCATKQQGVRASSPKAAAVKVPASPASSEAPSSEEVRAAFKSVQASASQMAFVSDERKKAVGKVERTIPIVGTNLPGIVIVDENGVTTQCVTGSYTVKLAKDGQAILLRDFKKGDKVALEYTSNARGVNRALSIKVIE